MISIIIPVYNESGGLTKVINQIRQASTGDIVEIIIVDGGSSDNTVGVAKACNTRVILGPKGRAKQMNFGAANASGNIFYFLHADSIPPRKFTAQIFNALRSGYSSGCFRLKFDVNNWFLNSNSWFTRFDINAVRFGDQSLFVTKDVFIQSGGFREDLLLMEDQEIIHRLKHNGRFTVLKDYVITSARKYEDNGIFRTQGVFYLIWFLYYLGFSQTFLLKLHKTLIRKDKQ